MQIEFADGVEVRTGLTARPGHIERGRAAFALRRIAMIRLPS
jgi:hypothetical protein